MVIYPVTYFSSPSAPTCPRCSVDVWTPCVAGLLAQVVRSDVEVLAGELVSSVSSDGECRLVVDVEHRPVAAARDGREERSRAQATRPDARRQHARKEQRREKAVR